MSINGSGLAQAASAQLLDGQGNVVSTSTAVTTAANGSTLTAQFPLTPAGTYTLAVLNGNGNPLALGGNAPSVVVAPALPLFSIEQIDTLPQLPGKAVTHIWQLTNQGSVDGMALIEFVFPSFLSPEPTPVLSAMPDGSVLLTHGFEQVADSFSSSSSWLELIAVPVATGNSVDVPWTYVVPPSAVFGSDASLSLGQAFAINPIVLDGTTLPAGQAIAQQVLAGTLDPFSGAQQLVSAGIGLLNQTLTGLTTLAPAALTSYTTQVAALYPALAQQLTELVGDLIVGIIPASLAASPSVQPATVEDAQVSPAISVSDGISIAQMVTQIIQDAKNCPGMVSTDIANDVVSQLAGLNPVTAAISTAQSLAMAAGDQYNQALLQLGIDDFETLRNNFFAEHPNFDPSQPITAQPGEFNLFLQEYYNEANLPNIDAAIQNVTTGLPPAVGKETTATPQQVIQGLHALEVAHFEAQFLAAQEANKGVLQKLHDFFFPQGQPIVHISAWPTSTSTTGGFDPNDITVTPAGVPDQDWVASNQTLTYVINFQNDPTAPGDAENIRVVAQLDPGLDPGTVENGSSSFPGTQFSFDPTTGTLTWLLPEIDLPPDTVPPLGEGYVSFTASPLASLPSGTSISEQAQVFFDFNPPIATPIVTRTISSATPFSSVQVLPAKSGSSFVVSWDGQEQAGPGIALYDVFVSDNGGPFEVFQSDTMATSATFTGGQDGHTYSFYSVATDYVDHVQPTPTEAQASTTVVIADRLAMLPPTQAIAGGKFQVTVDAVDANDLTDSRFTGTATLILVGGPANGKFTGTLTAPIVNGVATISNLTLSAAGTYTLLAASSSDLVATTGTVSVVQAPQFKVSLAPTTPGNSGSGQMFTATITALLNGKLDTAYLGSVLLTSSDPQTTPTSGSFQSGKGAITLSIALDTAGKQTVTVADTTLPSDKASSNAVTVTGLPLNLDHFLITGMPASDVVNVPHTVTITAVNAAGQTVTNFSGTVTLTSSDGSIDLPVVFPVKNNGVEKVSVTFTSTGTETLNASGGGKTGTETNIVVVSPATHLGIKVSPPTIVAGKQVTFTVTGLTSANKTDILFNDALQVTTSDPNAQIGLPVVANGVETFEIAFTTAGTQTITVADLARQALMGTSQKVTVSAAAVSQLVVTSSPLFAIAGSPVSVTVTAEDPFGNPVLTGFTDKVTLSTGQSYTFKNSDHGKHVFTPTFSAAGMQTLSASDSVPANVTASSPVTFNVVSTAVGVANDPISSGQQALIIIAPASGGNIVLTPATADGTSVSVTETVNGKKTNFGPFQLATSGHIIVYGQGGNDIVTEVKGSTGATITVPAILLGGSGTNTLSAAGSSVGNVLVGGPGKDSLTGGTGRDILIGGGGADTLHAGSGGDVLIGGRTAFDANLTALAALMAEWSSGDSYQTRVQDLFGTGTGGQNGSTLLDASTVINDAAINQLFSGSGQDWFWLEATDKISVVATGESVTVG